MLRPTIVFFGVVLSGVAARGGESGVRAVAGDVNLRAGPSLRAEVVGQLEKGQEVRMVSREGEWLQIVPPATLSAYVSGEYIRDGAVGGDRVNVRSGPGLAYARIAVLNRGDAVEELGRESGWVRISMPSSARLWVHADYMEFVPDAVPKFEGERVEVVVSIDETASPAGSEPEPSSSSSEGSESVFEPLTVAPVPREEPRVELLSGYVKPLAGPISVAGREVGYKLIEELPDSGITAWLAGGDIRLDRYARRQVRVWGERIEADAPYPVYEVKGIQVMW
ncbi:MAG TPA: SH3 domain-containing protein [bacterium]|nr:SH3 domain-containing protein [bacterium]HPQ65452.1 SH3 domain-containing protein [bacterium]